MTRTILIALTGAALTLSACAQDSITQQHASRMDNTALFFHNDPVSHGSVEQQADALNGAAKRLVRSSVAKGTMVGAALGCGISVLSGSNAQSCVTLAAVAGAGGAVAGQIKGKADVKRRVQLVSGNDVVKTLRESRKHLAHVKRDLPDFLADQEQQLNSLTMQLVSGKISQADHDAAVQILREERIALAHALTLSTQQVREAAQNLQQAQGNGQTGLDWHIGAATALGDDIASARSAITLL